MAWTYGYPSKKGGHLGLKASQTDLGGVWGLGGLGAWDLSMDLGAWSLKLLVRLGARRVEPGASWEGPGAQDGLDLWLPIEERNPFNLKASQIDLLADGAWGLGLGT